MPTPDSLILPNLRTKQKPLPSKRGAGRQFGAVNKITRDLKQGIVDAAAAHGADGFGAGGLTGYLLHLATNHPKAFSGLLGKLMPLQVNGTVQSVDKIQIVSIPADTYLAPDSLSKFKPAQTIEHEATIEQPINRVSA